MSLGLDHMTEICDWCEEPATMEFMERQYCSDKCVLDDLKTFKLHFKGFSQRFSDRNVKVYTRDGSSTWAVMG